MRRTTRRRVETRLPDGELPQGRPWRQPADDARAGRGTGQTHKGDMTRAAAVQQSPTVLARGGDTLAHRKVIQAPQPRLHTRPAKARGQPSVDRARAESTAFDARPGNWTDGEAIQPSGAARGCDQSLISYQALGRRPRAGDQTPFAGNERKSPQSTASLS